ncbi:MAG: hypothetical protein GOVbin1709_39 [Prokaryotic dsDNA virus sp.]|nr:MAG: hypothetical protein GOVbin1709_39 [Prokaryotic dsDNA virus sp.]
MKKISKNKYIIGSIMSVIQAFLLMYVGLYGSNSGSFQSNFCLIYSLIFLFAAAVFAYADIIPNKNKRIK